MDNMGDKRSSLALRVANQDRLTVLQVRITSASIHKTVRAVVLKDNSPF